MAQGLPTPASSPRFGSVGLPAELPPLHFPRTRSGAKSNGTQSQGRHRSDADCSPGRRGSFTFAL
jgi:hypothetical protein